jgi:hypothetical protein
MCDGRIAVDTVGAAPEEQIARLERIEFKRILVTAQDRSEVSRLTHPDILLAGIARHVGKSVLTEHVVNETRAIHSAVFGIGRAITVAEILFCQLEPSLDDLAHPWRIIVIAGNFVGQKRDVRCASSFGSRMHSFPWRR